MMFVATCQLQIAGALKQKVKTEKQALELANTLSCVTVVYDVQLDVPFFTKCISYSSPALAKRSKSLQ